MEDASASCGTPLLSTAKTDEAVRILGGAATDATTGERTSPAADGTWFGTTPAVV